MYSDFCFIYNLKKIFYTVYLIEFYLMFIARKLQNPTNQGFKLSYI